MHEEARAQSAPIPHRSSHSDTAWSSSRSWPFGRVAGVHIPSLIHGRKPHSTTFQTDSENCDVLQHHSATRRRKQVRRRSGCSIRSEDRLRCARSAFFCAGGNRDVQHPPRLRPRRQPVPRGLRHRPPQPDKLGIVESHNPHRICRYARSAVTIQAVDQNTGQLVGLGTATSATSATPYTAPGGVSYKLYQWSFGAGVLPANLWAPQTIVPDLSTGQGHLEIFASAGGQKLYTFSQAARDSWLASGKDLVASTPQYSDGTSTVLFDQDGVAAVREPGG